MPMKQPTASIRLKTINIFGAFPRGDRGETEKACYLYFRSNRRAAEVKINGTGSTIYAISGIHAIHTVCIEPYFFSFFKPSFNVRARPLRC
jgi:hypothetical protein